MLCCLIRQAVRYYKITGMYYYLYKKGNLYYYGKTRRYQDNQKQA